MKRDEIKKMCVACAKLARDIPEAEPIEIYAMARHLRQIESERELAALIAKLREKAATVEP